MSATGRLLSNQCLDATSYAGRYADRHDNGEYQTAGEGVGGFLGVKPALRYVWDVVCV